MSKPDFVAILTRSQADVPPASCRDPRLCRETQLGDPGTPGQIFGWDVLRSSRFNVSLITERFLIPIFLCICFSRHKNTVVSFR